MHVEMLGPGTAVAVSIRSEGGETGNHVRKGFCLGVQLGGIQVDEQIGFFFSLFFCYLLLLESLPTK